MRTKGRYRLFLFSLFLFLWMLLAASAWAEPSATPEHRALEYQLQIARTSADDAAERERLYLQIIAECPETEAAEEALWAVTNLYLDDFEEPRVADAQKTLEAFIARYPASSWRSHVESKLLWLYEGTGNDERVVELSEQVLKGAIPLRVRLPLALRCAAAYENLKRPDNARTWYTRIIKDAGNGNYPEVAVAKGRLAALKKR